MNNQDFNSLFTEINQKYPFLHPITIQDLITKYGSDRAALFRECEQAIVISRSPSRQQLNQSNFRPISYPVGSSNNDYRIQVPPRQVPGNMDAQQPASKSFPIDNTISPPKQQSALLNGLSGFVAPICQPSRRKTNETLQKIAKQKEHHEALQRRVETLRRNIQEYCRLQELAESLEEKRKEIPYFPSVEEMKQLQGFIEILKQRVEKENSSLPNILRHSLSCPPRDVDSSLLFEFSPSFSLSSTLHDNTPSLDINAENPIGAVHSMHSLPNAISNAPQQETILSLDELWPPLIPTPVTPTSSVHPNTNNSHVNSPSIDQLFDELPAQNSLQNDISQMQWQSSWNVQPSPAPGNTTTVRAPIGPPNYYRPYPVGFPNWSMQSPYPGGYCYAPPGYIPTPTPSSIVYGHHNSRQFGHTRQSSDGQLRWLNPDPQFQLTPPNANARDGFAQTQMQYSAPFASSASSLSAILTVKCCFKCSYQNSGDSVHCKLCGSVL